MYALLADIHGNHVALEAVLSQLDARQVENIIVLGDVAAGTAPRQVISRLRGLGCPIVMGNTDAWLLDPQPFPNPSERQKIILKIFTWAASQLTDEDKEYIRSFIPTYRVEVFPHKALFAYHGSPKSFDDQILPTTPDDNLRAFLNGQKGNIFAGGHTHAQMLRKIDNRLVINPGSVGLVAASVEPAGPPLYQPYAEYATLEILDGAININFHRVDYDVGELLYAARQLGQPELEWWQKHWRTG